MTASTDWLKIRSAKIVCYVSMPLNSLSITPRIPSFGVTVRSSQLDMPKPKAYSGGDSSTLSDTSDMSLDGWDGISLEYSIDWPLQLFFTQEVLSK